MTTMTLTRAQVSDDETDDDTVPMSLPAVDSSKSLPSPSSLCSSPAAWKTIQSLHTFGAGVARPPRACHVATERTVVRVSQSTFIWVNPDPTTFIW
eukprot:SAG25_NODE_10500_length_331_cov_1.073276_1_plen_95_part_01